METFDKAAEVLKAMAHPERLRLLAALRDGDQCVCHLTALLRERQPYVSQQLAYLRDAGLVADDRDGLNVYYHIRAPRVFVLLDMLGAVVGKPVTFREVRISARLAASCPCPHVTQRMRGEKMNCYICEKTTPAFTLRYGIAHAVGVCQDCGIGVCLNHSRKDAEPGSPLLCPECAEKRAALPTIPRQAGVLT